MRFFVKNTCLSVTQICFERTRQFCSNLVKYGLGPSAKSRAPKGLKRELRRYRNLILTSYYIFFFKITSQGRAPPKMTSQGRGPPKTTVQSREPSSYYTKLGLIFYQIWSSLKWWIRRSDPDPSNILWLMLEKDTVLHCIMENYSVSLKYGSRKSFSNNFVEKAKNVQKS